MHELLSSHFLSAQFNSKIDDRMIHRPVVTLMT